MATILRNLSYRYPWLYDSISRVAALAVGGEARFRQLPIADVPITTTTQVLDLCCGGGQATAYLVQRSQHVTGLDASPRALDRAKRYAPQAHYIEALAQELPFLDGTFDLVHTSAALHEMDRTTLTAIVQEVYRVLKPGGVFTLVDFHQPTNPLMMPGLAIFMWLFETETAWALLKTDLPEFLTAAGFTHCKQQLYAGGSLQVVRAYR